MFEIGLTDLPKNGEDYSGGQCVDEDYKGTSHAHYCFLTFAMRSNFPLIKPRIDRMILSYFPSDQTYYLKSNLIGSLGTEGQDKLYTYKGKGLIRFDAPPNQGYINPTPFFGRSVNLFQTLGQIMPNIGLFVAFV